MKMIERIREEYPDARHLDEHETDMKEYMRFISQSTIHIAERLKRSDTITIYKMEGRIIE